MQTTIQNKRGLSLRIIVGLALCSIANASGSADLDGSTMDEELLFGPHPIVKEPWPFNNDQFSYTYLQATYGGVSNSGNENSSRLAARLLVGLGSYAYVGGEFSQTDADNTSNGVDVSSLSMGGHLGMTSEIDMYAELGYRTQTQDVGNASIDSDGPLAAFGFRGISPDRMFEAEARYTRNWLSTDGGGERNFGNFRFELLWRATDHFSLVAGGDWEKNGSSDTIASYSFGLREPLSTVQGRAPFLDEVRRGGFLLDGGMGSTLLATGASLRVMLRWLVCNTRRS